MFCISCGFSVICDSRLCIPGEVNRPAPEAPDDDEVEVLVDDEPPVVEGGAQGFGSGAEFSPVAG